MGKYSKILNIHEAVTGQISLRAWTKTVRHTRIIVLSNCTYNRVVRVDRNRPPEMVLLGCIKGDELNYFIPNAAVKTKNVCGTRLVCSITIQVSPDYANITAD